MKIAAIGAYMTQAKFSTRLPSHVGVSPREIRAFFSLGFFCISTLTSRLFILFFLVRRIIQ